MTITAEQLQLLVDALNAITHGLELIASAIGTLGFLGFLFLFFKKMG
jgi:hypothetical protein